MNEIQWLRANENQRGIHTIGMKKIDNTDTFRLIGYNGFIVGEIIPYKGKLYSIVSVSNEGFLGLSEAGNLPCDISIYPGELPPIIPYNNVS